MEFWRKLFSQFDYYPVDCIRPAILRTPEVQYWYRYNTMLYVAASHLDSLSPEAKKCMVPNDERLRNYWPITHRLMQAVLRSLPIKFVDLLARLAAKRYSL